MRPCNDFVVNVRNVLQVEHFISGVSEVFNDNIERNVRPGMSDMRRIIDRWSADKKIDPFVVRGFKVLFFVRESVIDSNHSFFIP